MDGRARAELQEALGTRPIVEDVNALIVSFGHDAVTVSTPIVETKLRSGDIPRRGMELQVVTPIVSCGVTISFEIAFPVSGYPISAPLTVSSIKISNSYTMPTNAGTDTKAVIGETIDGGGEEDEEEEETDNIDAPQSSFEAELMEHAREVAADQGIRNVRAVNLVRSVIEKALEILPPHLVHREGQQIEEEDEDDNNNEVLQTQQQQVPTKIGAAIFTRSTDAPSPSSQEPAVDSSRSDSINSKHESSAIRHEDFRFRCRSCRTSLFEHSDLNEHCREMLQLGALAAQCSSYYLSEPQAWMTNVYDQEGKIVCPTGTCRAKLGYWKWAGEKCSCPFDAACWISPSFKIVKSKIDAVAAVGAVAPAGEEVAY